MDSAQFWANYKDITKRLKKKYLFKRIPYAEAKDNYLKLLNDVKKFPPEYQALVVLALARCEEGLAKEEREKYEGNNKRVAGMLEESESARRRAEYSRLFFESIRSSVLMNDSDFCSSLQSPSIPPISDHLFPTFPIHESQPLSQVSSAIQSYLQSILIYEKQGKNNMASSLKCELAMQLELNGEKANAANYWKKAGKSLLTTVTKVPTPDSKLVEKKVNLKPSNRSPFTALALFSRSLQNNILTSNLLEACKIASKILELIDEERQLIPNGAEQMIETLLTLFLLYIYQRELAKAHKILQRITHDPFVSEAPTDHYLWQIDLNGSDFHIDLYDFLMAYNEKDIDCLEHFGGRLYPHLNCLQQEILILILEQNKLL